MPAHLDTDTVVEIEDEQVDYIDSPAYVEWLEEYDRDCAVAEAEAEVREVELFGLAEQVELCKLREPKRRSRRKPGRGGLKARKDRWRK